MKTVMNTAILASAIVATTAFAPMHLPISSSTKARTRLYDSEGGVDADEATVQVEEINLEKGKISLQEELWGTPTLKDGEQNVDTSRALPFVARPHLLDGTLAGDVGFDPFGFGGEDMNSLLYMREAELKHSRLAMLAVIGWPLAELFDKPLANMIGLPDALTRAGESPSLVNGGLDAISPAYWLGVIGLAGVVELAAKRLKDVQGSEYVPGDCGFDPLGLYPSDEAGRLAMQTKEVKHGRLAMMAILGFVAQEALYGTPIVSQTPFFFHPIF